jgi:hypothetical protein
LSGIIPFLPLARRVTLFPFGGALSYFMKELDKCQRDVL